MNSGLIAVFQFVVSLACAFFFGFVGVELFIGNLQLAVRLLLGIACALIVGVAELYFLAMNMSISDDGPGRGSGNSRMVKIGPAMENPVETPVSDKKCHKKKIL
jgi:hypothetical protein